jgi:hypothetical protein
MHQQKEYAPTCFQLSKCTSTRAERIIHANANINRTIGCALCWRSETVSGFDCRTFSDATSANLYLHQQITVKRLILTKNSAETTESKRSRFRKTSKLLSQPQLSLQPVFPRVVCVSNINLGNSTAVLHVAGARIYDESCKNSSKLHELFIEEARLENCEIRFCWRRKLLSQ